MKELDIEALTDNLDTVLQFVDSALEKTDCSPKIRMQIDLAVEEIFVNIATYAYHPETGPACLRIDVQPDGSVVRITFIDHGIPYDPLKKADPDITLKTNDREIGGLGIFLVKKTMDHIRYEYVNGSNILTIEKGLTT
ncbi:MAG TPA: ATP-binding protein [Ruminococcus sp.]|nr:ATP-binding protein [Ruminococcus sp.]